MGRCGVRNCSTDSELLEGPIEFIADYPRVRSLGLNLFLVHQRAVC